jgi:hypothetical protein
MYQMHTYPSGELVASAMPYERTSDASKDAMIAALRAKITEVRARLARSGDASA